MQRTTWYVETRDPEPDFLFQPRTVFCIYIGENCKQIDVSVSRIRIDLVQELVFDRHVVSAVEMSFESSDGHYLRKQGNPCQLSAVLCA